MAPKSPTVLNSTPPKMATTLKRTIAIKGAGMALKDLGTTVYNQ